jgi:hypothetical protein
MDVVSENGIDCRFFVSIISIVQRLGSNPMPNIFSLPHLPSEHQKWSFRQDEQLALHHINQARPIV